MTATIVKLKPSLDDIIQEMRKLCPNAKEGVIAIFDEDGKMHCAMNLTDQQLALVACRFMQIAGD
jgi:hypothetical protein